MSKRRDRARGTGGEAGAAAPPPQSREPERRAEPKGGGLLPQLALLTAVFALAVLVAELAGAANLGVSLGVGQVAFVVALVVLFSRR